MRAIIKVENLGKKYIIRHEHPERYVALRDVLTRKAQKLFSFPANLRPKAPMTDYEEFWALKDLNFDIQQGDRVGIIGRNGAGKSTLLKILSRITEPSTGRITLNGRVASLLEVGTGFHPELTGRENIFLNGAILGMSRLEIRQKFDEIVDFSGVEKFLDTPVKRYSSGMYVRLAFAVAAHLEPEILVVDEVLAVGDAEFQKKCLGKMEDVSKNEGRTVLFVSHNMDAIESLTNQAIYLKNSRLEGFSNTRSIIEMYLSSHKEKNNIRSYSSNKNKSEIRISNIYCCINGIQVLSIKQGQSFEIVIGVEASRPSEIDMNFVIENIKEQALFCSHFSDINKLEIKSGYYEVKILINIPYLRTGDYLLSSALFRKDKTEYFDTILHFPFLTIEGSEESSTFPIDSRWGDFYFPIKWSYQ